MSAASADQPDSASAVDARSPRAARLADDQPLATDLATDLASSGAAFDNTAFDSTAFDDTACDALADDAFANANDRANNDNNAAPDAVGRLGFCVLGSGSGGNCSVVAADAQAMLIDAGLGPVVTARRLKSLGLAVHQLKGVCLTHLDHDHFRPNWIATLVQWQIPVYIHAWHAPDLEKLPHADRLLRYNLVRPFDHAGFAPLPGLTVDSVRLRHDDKGTTGYRFTTQAGSIGFATDLGHVPKELIERFTDVDLLAIESNYDEQMQTRSTRPMFLKRRIMGTAGHLSNDQAYQAVVRIAARSRDGLPQHVVLLHPSSQCNTPECIMSTFGRNAALCRRITLTHQRKRTRWISIRRLPPLQAQQMTMGF